MSGCSGFLDMFHFAGLAKFDETCKIPTSPWLAFPTLISVLSKFLPSPAVSLISNLYKDHKVSALALPFTLCLNCNYQACVSNHWVNLAYPKVSDSRHENATALNT